MLPLPLKLLWHVFGAHRGRFSFQHPLGIFVHLTYRCNFACEYCDSGRGQHDHQQASSELTITEWDKALNNLARYADILFVSGGEPTLYHDLPGFLVRARNNGFRFITLNTNAFELSPTLFDLADVFIVSLDSMRENCVEKLCGSPGVGAFLRVKHNLDVLSQLHKPVVINAAIHPETLDEAEDVFAYCREKGFTYSPSPILVGNEIMPELKADPRFRAFFQKLAIAKRHGARISGSYHWLRMLPTFPSFACHSLLVWHLNPSGQLLFPCNRFGGPLPGSVSEQDPLQTFFDCNQSWMFSPDCKFSVVY